MPPRGLALRRAVAVVCVAVLAINLHGCGGEVEEEKGPKHENCEKEVNLLCAGLLRLSTHIDAAAAQKTEAAAAGVDMKEGQGVPATNVEPKYPSPRDFQGLCEKPDAMVSICHEKCEQFETNVQEDVYALRMCLAQSIILSNIYTYNGDVQCEHYIRGVCDEKSEERVGMTDAEIGLMKKDPINVDRWCKSPKMKEVLVEQCKLWCPKQPQAGGVSEFPPDAGPGQPGLSHMDFTKCVVQLEDSLIASGEWETLVKDGSPTGPFEGANAGKATPSSSAPGGATADATVQQIKDGIDAVPPGGPQNQAPLVEDEEAPLDEGDDESSGDVAPGGAAAAGGGANGGAEPEAEDDAPPPDGGDGGVPGAPADPATGLAEVGSDQPDPPPAAKPQLLARVVTPSGA